MWPASELKTTVDIAVELRCEAWSCDSLGDKSQNLGDKSEQPSCMSVLLCVCTSM